MPNLGIVASSISGHLTPPSSFYNIATSTPSSGTTSITLSSIPSTYKSLQLRINGMLQTTSSSWNIQLNGDTGSHYAFHALDGDGSTAAARGVTGTDGYYLLYKDGMNAGSYPTTAIIDIIDYSSTSKYKTVRGISGQDRNGSGSIELGSSLWLNTAAINSITVNTVNSATGTSIALYGVN
jgi:hypothetical protein